MDFSFSAKTQALQAQLQQFMDAHIYPAETDYRQELEANTLAGRRWTALQTIEKLKPKARAAGLWNLFLPDDRFGQSVAAIASLEPGASASPEELIEHVRARLSHYKAPRRLLIVAKVPRAPNGKPDYPTAKDLFAAGQS